MSNPRPHIYSESEIKDLISSRADQERSKAAQDLQDGLYRLLLDIDHLPAEVASGAILRAIQSWRQK